MRFDATVTNSEAMRAMLTLSKYAEGTALDKKLVELVKIRASQINRCAYCLDMHTRDALKLGESERRLHVVAAWRESGMFSEPERAALRFTEALTTISHSEISDELFAELRRHFSEREVVDLAMVINTINCWNRLTATSAIEPPPIEGH